MKEFLFSLSLILALSPALQAHADVFPGFSGKLMPFTGEFSGVDFDSSDRPQSLVIANNIQVNPSSFKNFTAELTIGGCAFFGAIAGGVSSIDENGNYSFPPTTYNLSDLASSNQAAADDGTMCVDLAIFDKNHNRIDDRFGKHDVFSAYNEDQVPSATEVQKAFGIIPTKGAAELQAEQGSSPTNSTTK